MDRLADVILSIPGGLWSIMGALIVLTLALGLFSLNLWWYGGEIKKLNEFNTMTQLTYLSKNLREGIEKLGEQTAISAETRARVDELLDAIMPMAGSLREQRSESETTTSISAALHAGEVAQHAPEDAASAPTVEVSPNPPPSSSTAPAPLDTKTRTDLTDTVQQMYDFMIRKYDRVFIPAFKARIEETNIHWDGRMIGDMAYRLADRRRNRPLDWELANEIADLHGQFKSYTGAQATKEHWLKPHIRDQFVSSIDRVVGKLKRG